MKKILLLSLLLPAIAFAQPSGQRYLSSATDSVSVTDGAGALNVIVDSGTTAVTQATATNLKTQIFGDDITQAIDTDAAGQLQVDVLTVPTITVNSHAVTNAGTFAVQVDGSALTALQKIDDPVQVLGTDTYTEATSSGMTCGAVRRDADTTLVNTTNEFGPLQMDANGRLKVEAFSGETLPVSLTSTTVTGSVAITAASGSIASGALASGSVASGAIASGAVASGAIAAGAIAAGATSIAENEDTASADLDRLVKVAGIRDDTLNARSGTEGDYEQFHFDANGALWTDLNIAGAAAVSGSGTATGALRVEIANNGTGVVGLNTGTNSIGKLAANSGVDIGDVTLSPATSGGLTTFHLVSAATTNATVVAAQAAQLYGWYIYNSNASARKLAFHNSASSPTAGASIFFTVIIPGGSAANVFTDTGVTFSSGIAITTVTDLTDAGATAVAINDLNINLFYK